MRPICVLLIAAALIAPALTGTTIVVSVLGGAVGLALWAASRPNRMALLVVTLNVCLLLGYVWSLNESVHVLITRTDGGYLAQVGGDSLLLRVRPGARRVALFDGGPGTFRFGEQGALSSVFAELQRSSGPVGGILGLAWLGPGWRDVVVGGKPVAASPARSGAWYWNSRGELMPVRRGILPVGSSSARIVFDGELLRPAGQQGVALLDRRGRGYVLRIEVDQPDRRDDPPDRFWHRRSTIGPNLSWSPWPVGRVGKPAGGTFLEHQDTMPMLQRDIRLLLSAVVVADLLVLISLLLGLAAATLFNGLRRIRGARPSDDVGVQRQLPSWPGLAAGVLAVVFTGWIAAGALNGMPHLQDSVAYVFQARIFALGQFSVPAPAHPAFFTQQFVLTHGGRWFTKYPPGWPLTLAAGVRFGFPWLVNPLLSGGVVVLTYAIGRRWYPHFTALFAAVLLLLSPLFLFLGGSLMSHTSTTLYVLAAIYLVLRARETSDRALQVVFMGGAGLAAGMAGITRELDAVVFLAPFVVLLWRRWAWIPVLATGVLLPVILMLMYNWSITGAPLMAPDALVHPSPEIGFGLRTEPYRFTFTVALGLWDLGYDLSALQNHLLGWPYGFALAFPIMLLLLGRANRWDALIAASSCLLAASYIAYWSPNVNVVYGPRYYEILAPWLCLLTARGITALVAWLRRVRLAWFYPMPTPAAALLPATLLLLFVVHDLVVYLPAQLRQAHGLNGVTPVAQRVVEPRVGARRALVFVASPRGEWQPYGAVFWKNSPLLDNQIVYARDLGSGDRVLRRAMPGRRDYLLHGTRLTAMDASSRR